MTARVIVKEHVLRIAEEIDLEVARVLVWVNVTLLVWVLALEVVQEVVEVVVVQLVIQLVFMIVILPVIALTQNVVKVAPTIARGIVELIVEAAELLQLLLLERYSVFAK